MLFSKNKINKKMQRKLKKLYKDEENKFKNNKNAN